MYHGHLKWELLEYWRQLTLGPLFVTDELATQYERLTNATKDTLRLGGEGGVITSSMPYESTVLLADMDKANVLGLTATRAKQQRLAGQVATFDVVFEYNKTVEHWQNATRPTTRRLAEVLYHVASFLVEFSENTAAAISDQKGLLAESRHPPFLRRPLDFGGGGSVADPGLGEIGIFPYAFEPPPEFAGHSEEGSGDSSVAGSVADERAENRGVPGFGRRAPPQGPHFSGPAAGKAGTVTTGSEVGQDDMYSARHKHSGDEAGAEDQDRASVFAVARHYFYDRWLWIQFPWLALANATAASQIARAEAQDQFLIGGRGSSKHRSKGGNNASLGAGGSSSSNGGNEDTKQELRLQATMEALQSSSDRRYWEVKRVNPLVDKEAIQISQLKTRTRISRTVANTYEQGDVEFSDGRLRKLNPWAPPFARSSTPPALAASASGPMLGLSAASTQAGARATSPAGLLSTGASPKALSPPGTAGAVPGLLTPSSSLEELAAALGMEPPPANPAAGKSGVPPRMILEPKPVESAPSRKDCEEGTAAPNSIPYSYSSAKSLAKGTRFPSVARLQAEKRGDKEKQQDADAAQAAERFGGLLTPRNVQELLAEKLLELHEGENTIPHGVGDIGFLPAHTAIFAVSEKETAVADIRNRVGKLRKAYNQVLGHKQRKEKAIEEMRRTIAARQDQDEFILQTVLVGEQTMEALETRLKRMHVEIKACEALGNFYSRILHHAGVTKNPACEKLRLQEMEQQVELSRQQVKDLLSKRHSLYMEKERVDKTEVKQLKQRLKRTRGMRAALSRRLARNTRQVEDLLIAQGLMAPRKVVPALGDLQGYNDVPAKSSARAAAEAFSEVFNSNNSVASSTSGVGAIDGQMVRADPMKMSPSLAASSRAVAYTMEGARSRKAKGGVEAALEAERAKVDRTKVEQQKLARQIAQVEDVYGTKFQDNEHFVRDVVDKMQNNDRLSESLFEQQKQLENRVAKLKAEYNQAQKELEELQLGGKGGAAGGSGSGDAVSGDAGLQHEMRRLDEETFKAEIRCNQIMRKSEKSYLLIQSVKTGVQHLARLILRFDKAGFLPPKMAGTMMESLTDEDVERCYEDNGALLSILHSCEAHITAVKEALSVGKQLEGEGKGGPGNADAHPAERPQSTESRSPKSRQSISSRGRSRLSPSSPGSPKSFFKGSKKQKEQRKGMVRVLPRGKIDEHFEKKMGESMDASDLREQQLEDAHVGPRDETKGIKLFLQEALTSGEVQRQQRRTNMIGKKKQGHTAPLGLAMDDILYEKRRTMERGSTTRSAVNTRLQTAASSVPQDIVSRGGLKSSAAAVATRKRLEMKREKKRRNKELADSGEMQ